MGDRGDGVRALECSILDLRCATSIAWGFGELLGPLGRRLLGFMGLWVIGGSQVGGSIVFLEISRTMSQDFKTDQRFRPSKWVIVEMASEHSNAPFWVLGGIKLGTFVH